MKTSSAVLPDSLKTRNIDYVRISVTDKCNLRCFYCMPKEGLRLKPKKEILTLEEIIRLAGILASLGVKKIRLTGGEPLIRRDIMYLIRSLISVKGIEEISLTTNGVLLSRYAKDLRKAGVRRVNVSLDTLRQERFRSITGMDSLADVIEGIRKAKAEGLDPIKLNTVIMKGINDDEIADFADFGFANGLIARFIEFMKVTPLWDEKYFLPLEAIKDSCGQRFCLTRVRHAGSSPAEYYRANGKGLLGFIKTDEGRCRRCNRLRLSSTGELRVCLYQESGTSMKTLLRSGRKDAEVRQRIEALLKAKQRITHKDFENSKVYMSDVGG